MRIRTFLGATAFLVLMGAALFLIAGSLAVPSIWLYLGLRELFTAASVLAMSEEVARERLKPGRGSRREPLYTIGAGVLWIVHFIVAALDLGRIGWSAGFPLWLQGLGVAGTLGAYGLVIWALRHNEYLSARIRIQSDRGHRVADTGPYAYIRHPNYAGAALMGLTSGLVFGSWPSVLPILLWIGLLVYRTLMEERVLHAGLEGYTEYTERVCWRFLPGVW